MAKLRLSALAVAIALLLLGASSVLGAPAHQTISDNIQVGAQTTITLTVKLADGSTISVPVDLQMTTKIRGGAASMDVNANVGQSPYTTSVSAQDIPAMIETVAVTPTATVTATDALTVPVSLTANKRANLRQGPGTDFARAGSVQPGETLEVVAQNSDGTWLQLSNGDWIAAFLVDDIPGNLPIVGSTTRNNTSIPLSSPEAPPAANTPLPTPTDIPVQTSTDTPTPLPTATPLPTSTPLPTLQSQGLGILFEEWKALHGEPTEAIGGSNYNYDKPEGSYFIINYNGRLSHVERSWPTGSWPSFDEAKLAAQALMPQDAEYQSSYQSPYATESYVEVYFSQQLADVYPDALYSETIGEFIVIYHRRDDDTVSSIIVGTGNNP